VAQGGLIPLQIIMAHIEGDETVWAVLRDLTAWKHTAEELTSAKQAAEKAWIDKSEFLAKISHKIRTQLNAIIGFSALMMDQRFGPVGNERYRQYLKDINASGGHLISMLDDLMDLSKIEAGKHYFNFNKRQFERFDPAVCRYHAATGQPCTRYYPYGAVRQSSANYR